MTQHATGIVATYARLRGKELQNAWGELLARVPWQLFVTLTFDSKRVWDVDRELTAKEARWWCGEVGRLTRCPVAWVIAPEQGVGGRWHAHALLAGLPLRGELGPAPERMWRQRNGFIKVERVTDVDGIALYTTKAAALTGEIEISDTLTLHKRCTSPTTFVKLYPTISETES